MSKTYSQRDFAHLVGVSTATVANMVKAGEIKKGADGHIPQTEVQRYYENIVRKLSARGTLVITLNETEEGINRIKSDFERYYASEKQAVPSYFSSVNDIIAKASHKESSGDTTIEAALVQEKYNVAVLNSFMQQYRAVVVNYFASLVSDGEYPGFCKLPCDIVFDLLLYGKVFAEGYYDSAVEDFLSSVQDCISAIQFSINAKFELLMRDLKLIGKDNQLLFRREHLTPEFFECKGALYNSFFYNNSGMKDICYISHNEKIIKAVLGKSQGKKIKENIINMLDDGFYTICNISTPDDTVSATNAASFIGSGFYGNLLIFTDEATCRGIAGGLLWTTASIAGTNKLIDIEYVC